MGDALVAHSIRTAHGWMVIPDVLTTSTTSWATHASPIQNAIENNGGTMPVIGVLALQGAFIEHVHKLQRIGVDAREIRLPEQLEHVDGLIIPGGESTTIGKLIDRFDLREPIYDLAATGKPVWGTCAGMILLAREVDAETRARSQPLLGLMDLSVTRNAFGSQLDSFETDLSIPAVSPDPIHAVFIRAPVISSVGADVDVLSSLDDGRVVAVRQGNLVATSFHPELTPDDRLHAWFADLAHSGVTTGATGISFAT